MIGLKPSQVNGILQLMHRNGLDFKKLAFASRPDAYADDRCVARLLYSGTDYFFELGRDPVNRFFMYTCSPGMQVLVGHELITESWEACLKHLDLWLARLRTELDEADQLLHVLETHPQMDPGLSAQLEDSSLPPPSAEQVHAALRDWREQVLQELTLTQEQIAIINDRMAVIESAVTRFGKKDFYFLALGTVVNMAAEHVITTAAASDLCHCIEAAIKGVYRGLIGRG